MTYELENERSPHEAQEAGAPSVPLDLTGKETLLRMAEALTEGQSRVAAAAGAAAVRARRTPKPGTVSVIPGTNKRVEYHHGFTVINHGTPPSDSLAKIVRRFLASNPEIAAERKRARTTNRA